MEPARATNSSLDFCHRLILSTKIDMLFVRLSVLLHVLKPSKQIIFSCATCS